MASKNSTAPSFPLLEQIDEGAQSNDADWNKNAFQTLLTSNLPAKTIAHYAIDVGLRWLESSLYETYWDVTADALNDVSQFLFKDELDDYTYEARCQLLMYAATAMIKVNTIRRRSIHDAKLACATICLLLLQQSRSYERSSTANDYSACARAMQSRYFKRIFIAVQWLPTLTEAQMADLQSNHERYIAIVLEQLFPAVSLRDKITQFIDNQLFSNNANDDDARSSGFVLIRRFPKLNQEIIGKYDDLMNLGLQATLNQFYNNNARKLICCIWTLSCMIEANRVSPETINANALCTHFSLAPVDFEQKTVTADSLNERDVVVFLLLCAQQNVHLHGAESILHPYLLFSASHLCTQQQKNWWQTAIEQTPWNEFTDHLATIRLTNERTGQHPPRAILLETARILFQTAHTLYQNHAKRAAASYENYAAQYLQVAKHDQNTQGSSDTQGKGAKQEKLFFFYTQKTLNNDPKYLQQLTEQCEKLADDCEELKSLPEPPKTSSPTKEQPKDSSTDALTSREPSIVPVDVNISALLSPVPAEKEEPKHSEIGDSTLFATPPSIKSRDVDVQTFIRTPSPPPAMPAIDEAPEIVEPPLPPHVDVIFSHMNGVNQWINQFCVDSEMIQNDIHTIRERLEKINRITSQMMFSNMKTLPAGPQRHADGFTPPH